MKKIMFDNKYGLEDAAVRWLRKNMTRRLVPQKYLGEFPNEVDLCEASLDGIAYKVGEVVAVAQSYKDCGYDPGMLQQAYVKKPTLFPELDPYSKLVGWVDLPLKYHKGWSNKMFVLAGLMPHQIRITSVRAERLQDITEEDCLSEGIIEYTVDLKGMPWVKVRYGFDGCEDTFGSAREAFAAMIDKVSGRGTWDRNPWVFAYSFKLVK